MTTDSSGNGMRVRLGCTWYAAKKLELHRLGDGTAAGSVTVNGRELGTIPLPGDNDAKIVIDQLNRQKTLIASVHSTAVADLGMGEYMIVVQFKYDPGRTTTNG